MRSPAKVAVLLFGSGFCALVYQTAWLRQFRLIFGASTFATAAVLAIFMAGLGVGSALLGKRADAHPRPLAFYGTLELFIAISAAVSPLLLWLIAKIYFAIGGSVTLGTFGASVVRLILSTVVLGLPTLLMGGTLPAAARAVETNDDNGRRRLALLYGSNTLGAVVGTLLSTFYLLEHLGNRQTLFLAVGVNVVVALVARAMATDVAPGTAAEASAQSSGSRRLVFIAAAIVGFAFLLMELVWYRMLGPLLGGSTFTFGLILALALLGIGLGGAAYAFWGGAGSSRQKQSRFTERFAEAVPASAAGRAGRATAGGFALTCSLEAVAIAIPFTLGDRLATQENLLRSLGALGFSGFVIAWTLLTIVVVLPAAFISGVQFPLLISLLGAGRDEVGRDVGVAYAWNTAGAIAGSLAGGFGLLPLLSAPGSWRLVIILLAIVGIVAAVAALRQTQVRSAIAATAIAVVSIACTFALGPTAVWRHSGIGAGRSEVPDTVNAIRRWTNAARSGVVWDEDGRESSVALVDTTDYAFVVNGKIDGSARGDAGTQIMAGLTAAMLHPNPRRSLVIGLGTGSTAGWLGAVPTMQRVDVVELEPAVLRVARACTPVNHDVLHNPKVNIRIGDAREVLLTTRDRYDVIFSEPSNPYRAGIASLFTLEFYRSISDRLQPDGIFAQWVQTYEVDSQTIREIYATAARAFPFVETWQTDAGDVLLVATKQPLRHDAAQIRARAAQEPYRSALANAWRVFGAEGFLAHFVARETLSRAIANGEPNLNTDDKTLVEFGFARGLGGGAERFDMDQLTGLARARHEDRPVVVGAIDWARVDAIRASIAYVNALPNAASDELLARSRMAKDWDNGRLPEALADWQAHPFAAVSVQELASIGEELAENGNEAAAVYAEQLRPWQPVDADAILAQLRFHEGDFDGAAALLERAFVRYRVDPWPTVDLLGRALDLAVSVAKTHRYARRMYDALAQPFAAGQWNHARLLYRFEIAKEFDGCGPHTVSALRALEPWPPWREFVLTARRDCYASSMLHPWADRAKRDYDAWYAAEPVPLSRGLK